LACVFELGTSTGCGPALAGKPEANLIYLNDEHDEIQSRPSVAFLHDGNAGPMESTLQGIFVGILLLCDRCHRTPLMWLLDDFPRRWLSLDPKGPSGRAIIKASDAVLLLLTVVILGKPSRIGGASRSAPRDVGSARREWTI
jgi:hypothetical protein